METINDLINNNWFIALLCVIAPPVWKILYDLGTKRSQHNLDRSLHSATTAFSKIYAEQFGIYVDIYRRIDNIHENFNSLKKYRSDSETFMAQIKLLQEKHQETYALYKENRIFFSEKLDKELNVFFITLKNVCFLQEITIKNKKRSLDMDEKLKEMKTILDRTLCATTLDESIRFYELWEDIGVPIDELSFHTTLALLKREFRAVLQFK